MPVLVLVLALQCCSVVVTTERLMEMVPAEGQVRLCICA